MLFIMRFGEMTTCKMIGHSETTYALLSKPPLRTPLRR